MSGIPFARDAVVEITQGMSRGQRGVVVGPARSMYLGTPDVELRMEDGGVRWLRPDFLRQLAPAPTESDDDLLSPLRRVRCP